MKPDADEPLRELLACEALCHRPPADVTTAALEAMFADGFREIGASGRVYERREVIEVLQRRRGDPDPASWRTSGAACRRLADSTWLLTYTLDQHGRLTRRATIWRRTARGWVALHHQGTPVRAG